METIEEWIEGTPRGVNYQAIVWCPDSEGARILARFEAELEAALGSNAELFHSSPGSSPTGAPDEHASSSVEPPSGFSLPLTWFIAVGVAVVAVAVARSCSA